MNFNSVLDFFMSKEKQSNSINSVQNAIKSMNKMMKFDSEDIDEKNNILNDELSLSLKSVNGYL